MAKFAYGWQYEAFFVQGIWKPNSASPIARIPVFSSMRFASASEALEEARDHAQISYENGTIISTWLVVVPEKSE